MPNYFISILFFFSFLSSLGQGIRSRFYLPEGTNNSTRAVFEMSPHHYFGAGFSDKLTVMGLDSILQPVWIKKYGTNKFQYLNNLYTTRAFYKSGNHVFFIGAARDSNNKQIGVFVKFDSNGDTLWQKIYRDTLEDIIPQMVTASVDGGFLITGFFQNWINHTQPCLLIKTDINGKELWRKRLHKTTNPNVSDGKAIVQGSATKKIVLAGYQYLNGNNIHERILILDSVGNIIANPFYANSAGAVIRDLIQTKDKKFVLSGATYDGQTIGGFNLHRAYIVKFDINSPNNSIWKVEVDKLTLNNSAHCIREMKNGDILVAGDLDTAGIMNKLDHIITRVLKIDTSGKIKFKRYYDFKNNDTTVAFRAGIKSLELTNDSGWVVALNCVNFPTPNPFFFVKYDGTGCDSSLAYCAANYTTKPAVDVGLKEKLVNANLTVYPIPCFNELFLKSDIPIKSIQLFDISGKSVLTKSFDVNQTSYTLDVSQLSQGLYIAQLQTENGKQFVNVIKE